MGNMKQKYEISKAEVNDFPLWSYEGKVVVVNDEKMIDAAVSNLSKAQRIGIDTETKPRFSKGKPNRTALLQLAIPGVVYLFRLNKIGLPHGLAQILEDPNILKIGIATRDDKKELNRDFGCQPQNVLDLNQYVKTLGFISIGARKLTALILGKRISKSQQTSNWEKDKLSHRQILYAATDAWICLEIYQTLQSKQMK